MNEMKNEINIKDITLSPHEEHYNNFFQVNAFQNCDDPESAKLEDKGLHLLLNNIFSKRSFLIPISRESRITIPDRFLPSSEKYTSLSNQKKKEKLDGLSDFLSDLKDSIVFKDILNLDNGRLIVKSGDILNRDNLNKIFKHNKKYIQGENKSAIKNIFLFTILHQDEARFLDKWMGRSDFKIEEIKRYFNLKVHYRYYHIDEIYYSLDVKDNDPQELDVFVKVDLSIELILQYKNEEKKISLPEIQNLRFLLGTFPCFNSNDSLIINREPESKPIEKVPIGQIMYRPGAFAETKDNYIRRPDVFIRPRHGLSLKVRLSHADKNRYSFETIFSKRKIDLLSGLNHIKVGDMAGGEYALKCLNKMGINTNLIQPYVEDKDQKKEKEYERFFKDYFLTSYGMYDLSSFGRDMFQKKFSKLYIQLEKIKKELKINYKPSDRNSVLNVDDFIVIARYLIGISQKEKGYELDDKLHLKNRQIKLFHHFVSDAIEGSLKYLLYRTQLKFEGAKFKDSFEGLQKLPVKHFEQTAGLVKSRLDKYLNSSLCQPPDNVNPLSEVSFKRMITYCGPGGIKAERPNSNIEIRDIHPSHYGRLCVSETPEGSKVGLNLYMAVAGRINENGEFLTPYMKRQVAATERNCRSGELSEKTCSTLHKALYKQEPTAPKNNKLLQSDTINGDGKEVWLKPEEDEKRYIKARDITAENGDVAVRSSQNGIDLIGEDKVDLIDKYEGQLLGLSALLIPFLNHSDGTRNMMGAKNMKQALPLLKPEQPYIKTGYESIAGRLSRRNVYAANPGIVKEIGKDKIVVCEKGYEPDIYPLKDVSPTRGGTVHYHKVTVKQGENVKEGDCLAEGAACKDGELSLGINALVAYMSWKGYNFEDGIVCSESFAKRMSSIHIVKIEFQAKHGEQIIQDENGRECWADEGDCLEENQVLFKKINLEDMKEICKRVGRMERGKVIKIRRKENIGEYLNREVIHFKYEVLIERICSLKVGDKIMGRHGNKGVIAKIEPDLKMPLLPDGKTHVEVLLNPHGVISRMNLSQILETHWGWVVHAMGMKEKIVRPFEKISEDELRKALKKCGKRGNNPIDEEGKIEFSFKVSGEQVKRKIVAGYQYLLKLNHNAEKKIKVRERGRADEYSIATGQPVKGKGGGQRIGEMEFWVLQSHLAFENILELSTIKSDAGTDGKVKGKSAKESGGLNALKMLLRGALIDFELLDNELKIEWVTDDKALEWSSGKVGNTASFQKIVVKKAECEDCGKTILPVKCHACGHDEVAPIVKKGGKSVCPACKKELKKIKCVCGSSRMKEYKIYQMRPATNGLWDSEIFGDIEMEESGFKNRMGHIELAMPVKNPFFLKKKLVKVDDSEEYRTTLFFNQLPVLPLSLRIGYMRNGERLSSEIDKAYVKIISINNQLYRLIEQDGKDSKIVSELQQRLQKEISRLILGEAKNDFKGIKGLVIGRKGILRNHLLGKRVDYSARSVIVPAPELKFGEIGLPYRMAIKLLKENIRLPLMFSALPTLWSGQKVSQKKAKRDLEEECQRILDDPFSENNKRILVDLFKREFADKYFLVNRSASLHKYNILAFKPRVELYTDDAIRFHPLVCSFMNADFDGDTVGVYYPLSKEAQSEAGNRMAVHKNLWHVRNGSFLPNIDQDIVFGIYSMSLNEKGRKRLNELLEISDYDVTWPLKKHTLIQLLSGYCENKGIEKGCALLQEIMQEAFKEATKSGLTFGIFEVPFIAAQKRKKLYDPDPQKWLKNVTKRVEVEVKARAESGNTVCRMIDSGARGDLGQAVQLGGMRGQMLKPDGDYVKTPITRNLREGLNSLEYWLGAPGTRKGMCDKGLKTGPAGELTRNLVEAAYPLSIKKDDCGSKEGIWIYRDWIVLEGADAPKTNFKDRITGRTLAKELDVGGKIYSVGTLITRKLAGFISDSEIIMKIKVRSVLFCRDNNLCRKCYGGDLSTDKWIEMNMPVGIIAAQSIGERGVQLSMRTFHTGGASAAEITQNLPEMRSFFNCSDVEVPVYKKAGEKRVLNKWELLAQSVDNHEQAKGWIKVLDSTIENNIIDIVESCGSDINKFMYPLLYHLSCIYGRDVHEKHFEVVLRSMLFDRNGCIDPVGVIKAANRQDDILAKAAYRNALTVFADAAAMNSREKIKGNKARLITGKRIGIL